MNKAFVVCCVKVSFPLFPSMPPEFLFLPSPTWSACTNPRKVRTLLKTHRWTNSAHMLSAHDPNIQHGNQYFHYVTESQRSLPCIVLRRYLGRMHYLHPLQRSNEMLGFIGSRGGLWCRKVGANLGRIPIGNVPVGSREQTPWSSEVFKELIPLK